MLLSHPIALGLKPFISSHYSKDHIQTPWHITQGSLRFQSSPLLFLCANALVHVPLLSFCPFQSFPASSTGTHTFYLVRSFIHSVIHQIFIDHLLGAWHSAGQQGIESLRKAPPFLTSHTLTVLCFCHSVVLAYHASGNTIVLRIFLTLD